MKKLKITLVLGAVALTGTWALAQQTNCRDGTGRAGGRRGAPWSIKRPCFRERQRHRQRRDHAAERRKGGLLGLIVGRCRCTRRVCLSERAMKFGRSIPSCRQLPATRIAGRAEAPIAIRRSPVATPASTVPIQVQVADGSGPAVDFVGPSHVGRQGGEDGVSRRRHRAGRCHAPLAT